MEELVAVLIQGLLEFGLELLVYIGIDLPWRNKDGSMGCGLLLLFVAIGAGFGAVMNVIHPNLFLGFPVLRYLALIGGPIVAGTCSYGLALLRNRWGESLRPWEHFTTGFAFVLGFNIIRFAFGTR